MDVKKILVVVDMQNDFITGPLGNKECISTLPYVSNLIKNGDFSDVIFTQDTHDENYLSMQESKNLPVKHCIFNTYGWKIVPSLISLAKNRFEHIRIIPKPTFGSTILGETLKGFGKEYGGADIEITFCGVCTGICVISNVLLAKAFCPEAKIKVVKDACACVTPESHNTALEAMKLCQIEII